MRVVTKSEVFELLERAVAEKGPLHENPVCVLFDREDGTPCCIVGHVLSYLGVSRVEGKHVYTFAGSTQAADLRERWDLILTEDATEVLQIVQNEADSMRSWGEALETAKEEAS